MADEDEDWFIGGATFGGDLEAAGSDSDDSSDSAVGEGDVADDGLDVGAVSVDEVEIEVERERDLGGIVLDIDIDDDCGLGLSKSFTSDIGDELLSKGVVSREDLDTARKVLSQSPGKKLYEVLYDSCDDEVGLQKVGAVVYEMYFQRVTLDDVDLNYIRHLGIDYCVANRVLPISKSGSRLLLGVVRPDDLVVVDEIRHRLGIGIKPVVVARVDIIALSEALKEDTSEELDVDAIIGDISESEVEVVEEKNEELDLEKMAGESPVIRLVNYIIFNAVKEGASDIHVEPQENKVVIRYRIDGILFEAMSPPHQMFAALISRLKIMANLDISERRLPQDGRIRAMVHGRKLDLRLSTLPMGAGEKAVMRILDTRSINVSLNDLGMRDDTLDLWKGQISNPHGIILVTGPTGSGKTTTLYSSLSQMDRKRLNISTVEDPIEYHLNGINQCQTHDKIGMSFSAALRALLRQDPDVVMVGEIRDKDTAAIAIQASLTGHLVLSTLHTNDAPSAITRLINIGVEPFLIGAALNGTLAQRLVRKICPHCKTEQKPEEKVAMFLEMQGLDPGKCWVGEGCEKCRNTGYAGRVGIYEILIMDDFLRDKVAGNPSVTEFRRMCIERGMSTLKDDGFDKVAKGLTTVDEVLRVTDKGV